MTRVRARVDGTVQGVGFRPYVFRLAEALGLDGFVCNDERGVVLEVVGDPAAIERFLERLPREAPPLATASTVAHERIARGGAPGFRILESSARQASHMAKPAIVVSGRSYGTPRTIVKRGPHSVQLTNG